MDPGSPRVSVLPGAGLSFARYAPDADLRDVVESYWTLEVHEPPAVLAVIPGGLVDLTFVLGEPPGAYVTGPLTRPERYVHERPVSLLGVSLQPGAALPVLGVGIASLPAEWTPLSDVVGPVADELTARVAAETPVPARLPVRGRRPGHRPQWSVSGPAGRANAGTGPHLASRGYRGTA